MTDTMAKIVVKARSIVEIATKEIKQGTSE